jgi:hypothetical protein
VTVSLSASAQSELKSAFWNNSNEAVSRLLLRITFAYIASVLWQSGLHHASRGGLWLSLAYGRDAGVAKMATKTDHILVTTAGSTKPWVAWRHDPRRGSSTNRQNATALSLATMFTLLAQGRLSTPARSTVIADTLRSACTLFMTAKTMASFGATTNAPSKCGVLPSTKTLNDVALVEHGAKRYVAVALTRNVPKGFSFEQLIVDLDGLIS